MKCKKNRERTRTIVPCHCLRGKIVHVIFSRFASALTALKSWSISTAAAADWCWTIASQPIWVGVRVFFSPVKFSIPNVIAWIPTCWSGFSFNFHKLFVEWRLWNVKCVLTFYMLHLIYCIPLISSLDAIRNRWQIRYKYDDISKWIHFCKIKVDSIDRHSDTFR